jgi:hypothetical protein
MRIGYPMRSSNSVMISPALACRPSFDFSKMGWPLYDTSNRPPRDGIISMSASGYFALISAASLVARGV